MNRKQRTTKKGFTLMEVIISIAVIITALVASLALISFTISGARASKSTLIADSLAQEGLEIVRNIRDSGWFQGWTGPADPIGNDWREIFGEQDYRVEYNTQGFLGSGDPGLYTNVNGFYSHDSSGTPTPFNRTITIEYIDGGDTQIRVVCNVTWYEKGRNRSIQAETRLYNWYGAAP